MPEADAVNQIAHGTRGERDTAVVDEVAAPTQALIEHEKCYREHNCSDEKEPLLITKDPKCRARVEHKCDMKIG